MLSLKSKYNMFKIGDIISISLTLFAVIDILGSLPVLITLKQKQGTIQSGIATITAGLLMITFLLLGENLLRLIGIDVSSFAIAGSIIIFLIGMEMVLNIEFFRHDKDTRSGSIVPIAFPLIAGSGTLTTIISLKAAYSMADIMVGVVLNLILVYIVLQSTSWLERKLGPGGLAVLRKFFGIILLAIAIKLFKENI